jgi:hypothetical protein
LRDRLGARRLQHLSETAREARDALGGSAPHDILTKGHR